MAKQRQMEMATPPRPFRGRLQRRVARKGLRPRDAVYLIVAAWGAGVVVFGVVERLVDPGTFDNVWIAMWWAMQTVTTVGYGDIVPGQTAGKVIGSLLMLGGLSLYAVITGAVASAFVARAQAERRAARGDQTTAALEEMSRRLDAIETHLAPRRGGSG